jgi:putative restriction endonuclease
MSEYAVIAQNDESPWDDIKGELYHYPRTYKGILTPGCKIIYYKGEMKNSAFARHRLSPKAHYFGIGVVGDSIIDPDSSKADRYCEILNFQEFNSPVLAKDSNGYLEPIPESKKRNYWRFGVREISKEIYEKIVARTELKHYEVALPSSHQELESFQPDEGKKKVRFSTYYERNPFYRQKAIEIHGLSCMVCDFNFEQKYGSVGKGFIHVHHNRPISERGPTKIDPRTDMSVLCPNCHAMIHRKKEITLTLNELRKLLPPN